MSLSIGRKRGLTKKNDCGKTNPRKGKRGEWGMRNELTETGKREGIPYDRESSLIERAKDGESKAFDSLIRMHQPAVARRVRRLCRKEEDVEDIVQEVMITLYRKIDRFQGRSSLSTWLYRIATNAFLMYERRKRRDKLTFIQDEPNQGEDRAEAFGFHLYEPTDGFSYVYEKELQNSISEAMKELPEIYRQILLLRRRDGFSLREVSRLAKISVPSVKSRQYRGKQMLKAKISLDALQN
jgi:RNA polymerase sigma-70 factor (ECF subfamily)